MIGPKQNKKDQFTSAYPETSPETVVAKTLYHHSKITQLV
jgi:hypothetical protein